MSETKFTPGPWRVEYISERTVVRANCDVCAANGINEPVALAEAFYTGAGHDHPNRAHANARLIAAAPELYEALSELVRCDGDADFGLLDTEGSGPPEVAVTFASDELKSALGKARAALSKAAPDFPPQEKQQSESA